MIKVIDFWAEWCGPCMRMKPIFEEIKFELSDHSDKIEMQEINVESGSPLIDDYGVSSIPCFIFLKDGEEIKRLTGFMSKQKLTQEILSCLE